MISITQTIASHWDNLGIGYAFEIASYSEMGYPAWAVHLPDGRVGVAIPMPSKNIVNESFASVWVQSMSLKNIDEEALLVLSSYEKSMAFASFCADFIAPGERGELRAELINNPVAWWKEWKKLLGNKDTDKYVYDIIGELITLEMLSRLGKDPVWGGASRSTCDIDCGYEKYEVKSTTTRNSRTVEVHGLFQLADDGTEKYLLFAQFDPAVKGFSIDLMVDRLAKQGFSRAELDSVLQEMGYPRGNSLRRRAYRLIAYTQYRVDEAFPHISPNSFIGGELPPGVTSINYQITLDNLVGESLLAFVDNCGREVD